MTELGFWDDLDNFDDSVAPGGASSLFEDTDLFATEALDAASPATSSPPPSSPTSAVQQPQQQTAETQYVSLVTGAPVSSLVPLTHQAQGGRPWRGGSFLDSNCPLRRRVKVTITTDKGRDKARKRSFDQTAAQSPPRALSANSGPTSAAPAGTAKRPRTAVKMQTTLCFAPAGEAQQPRFHLDIRKTAAFASAATAPWTVAAGSKAVKRRAEKTSSAARLGASRKAAAPVAPMRIAPAPRAKTLSGAAAAAAAARLAKAAKASTAVSCRAGLVRLAAGRSAGGPLASIARSAKVASLAAGTANVAARAKAARTATVARRNVNGAVGGASSYPATLEASSPVTQDLRDRLAESAVLHKTVSVTQTSPVPHFMPALDAINAAAAAYRAILGDDEGERVPDRFDATADFDFISNLLD
jgi:hypothetical protein